MNNFQFQIFRELIKQSEIRENMVISPLSIYNIISLCANGAANKTLEEMVKALCNKNLEEINNINKSINSEIHNLKTVEIANAIFTIFDKSKLEKNFQNAAKRYKAHVDKLESSEKINEWCSNATNGKITKIIQKIDKDMKMLLINAIYFKGEWEKQFKKSKTSKREFMNYKKEKKLIDFMFIKVLKMIK